MKVLIENINEEVIHVNEKLDDGYKELNIEKIIAERERKSNGTKYVRQECLLQSNKLFLFIYNIVILSIII